MQSVLMNRRTAIVSLLAISASSALSACGNADAPSPRGTVDRDLDFATPTTFFNTDEMALIGALAGTILPKSETAGAVEAGVPDTIQLLASVWGDNNYRRYWRRGLADLNIRLSGETVFANMSATTQATALKRLDADVFDGNIENRFYRDFKATVIEAYYKSEPGASEELAYEPIPGEWIGCAPLSDYPKTWAV